MSEILSSTTRKIVWKIRNIKKDLFTSDKTNDTKFSNHFTLNNDEHFTEWYLRFQADKGDIQFHLCLEDSSTKDFETELHVSLVSSNSEGSIKRSFQRQGKAFDDFPSWGWPSFVDDKLMQNFYEFVVDETLTFSCLLTVEIFKKTPEPSNQGFFMSYNNFFQNETLCDFRIESKDGKTFNCHKLALALKSEVFEKMLTTGMKENQQRICKIEDFDSKIVDAMLKHIYFREIPNLEEIATKLIFAAEKYGLKELKKLCIGSMVQNLREENVIEALEISEKIPESDFLYVKCVAVVLNNWDNMMRSGGCKSLSHGILLKLYESHVDALTTAELLIEN